jgi:4a-hydroxytetrahydrobiopterin dehydratase
VTEEITPQQFHEAGGVDDWRVVFEGACACYVTGSFAKGVELVEAIGRLDSEHRPEIDLRHDSVLVRTRSHPMGALSARDASLAQQISRVASRLGLAADPSRVQTIQVAIDAQVRQDVMPFWRAVLGYEPFGDEDLVDPRRRGPALWFQEMKDKRTERNRLHIDVSLPPEEAEARVAAAVAAGGKVVFDEHAPAWWTLADPEGNEVDIAPWRGSY